MDKLTGLASKLGGKSSQPSGSNAGSEPKEDYLDKGLDAVEKQFGHVQNRSTNENITDTAREQFEKATGKKVPSKISN